MQQLSLPELEKLGMDAVAAGASTTDLQEAFANAHLKVDWTQLENLIIEALGQSYLPKRKVMP